VSAAFNTVSPFVHSDGHPIAEIEADPRYPKQVGKLWVNSTWMTIEQARELRDWLDEAIPREEPLDPRRGEEPIAANE
jgi:hypothetical protein